MPLKSYGLAAGNDDWSERRRRWFMKKSGPLARRRPIRAHVVICKFAVLATAKDGRLAGTYPVITGLPSNIKEAGP